MSDEIQVEYASNAQGGGVQSARWWKEKDPWPNVIEVVGAIDTYQNYRQRQALVYARLYSNMNLQNLYAIGLSHGVIPYGTIFGEGEISPISHRVTYNVIKSCIDTATSKIAKNKPRVMFLTSGGDSDQQRRAKNLTKYLDGLFDATGIYEAGQETFLDSCVWGSGFIKLWTEDSQVRVERVMPTEILVDDSESVYGKPRTMYQRKYIYRDVLMDMFGQGKEKKQAILAATGIDPTRTMGARASDMVPVSETWHLPSGQDAGDGRHAICINGATLLDEEWTKGYFPFVKFDWSPRLVGFYGQGLAEELVGIQIEINKLLRTIQKAQHLMSVPRVFVSRGSKIIKAHVNNDIGAIVETNGDPPTFLTPPAMSSEIYEHLERLFRKAYEITGISQLSAAAVKPAGINAAVALREYHEIESERFVVTGQRYEKMFVDAAKIMIDMSKDLYEGNRELMVNAPGAKFLEKIKWKDVNLEEDQYIMRAFPTSLLPTTPPAKFQKVVELYEAGFIDRERAMSLLDFPDVEAVMSLETAAIDDIKRILDRILERGKYESPEPYMNLELAVKMAQSTYLRARTESVDEHRLGLLRQFMDDSQDLLLASKPPEQETGLPETPAGPVPSPEALAESPAPMTP